MTSILRTEIFEQGDALARFLDAESANVARIAKKIRASNIESITIAARGTSDNAGMYGKYVFAAFNHLPVALATPSLYTVYQTPPQLKNTLVIGISQSGESPDILAVLQHIGYKSAAFTRSLNRLKQSEKRIFVVGIKL